jgi:hypothetical protein
MKHEALHMIGLKRLEARLEIVTKATENEAAMRFVAGGRRRSGSRGASSPTACCQPPLQRLDDRSEQRASRCNGSVAFRARKSQLGANCNFPTHVPQTDSEDSFGCAISVRGSGIEIPDAVLERGFYQPP